MTTHSDEGPHSALQGTDRRRRSDQPYNSLLEEPAEAGPGDSALEGRARAPRISREDVFRAADELLVEGSRPTIDRVRMRLGRGSPNTINDHLDTWWEKLGSRLRDLPGQEFPQLPERVAASLGALWNEALEAAHEALGATLARREQESRDAERALESRRAQLEQEASAAHIRAVAVDESLTLARAQLTESNQRAGRLEDSLKERDAALTHLRVQCDRLAAECASLTERLEAERIARQADRARLEERHESALNRWLEEVDRAREGLKAAERGSKDIQSRLNQAIRDRETLRSDLQELRAELKTALAVKEQLEQRLRASVDHESLRQGRVRKPAKRTVRQKGLERGEQPAARTSSPSGKT